MLTVRPKLHTVPKTRRLPVRRRFVQQNRRSIDSSVFESLRLASGHGGVGMPIEVSRDLTIFNNELARGVGELVGLLEYQPTVCIIGSNRITKDGKHRALYQQAVDLAYNLAHHGYHIICGVGPGVNEALVEGAKMGNRRSIIVGIQVGKDKKPIDGLTRVIKVSNPHIRKLLRERFSDGSVVLPGGFGTLDHLYESLTLIQTSKMNKRRPLLGFGESLWTEATHPIDTAYLEGETISPGDEKDLSINR